MKKILIQGSLSIGLFFGCWFAFNQINWIAVFRVEEASHKIEESLGTVFSEFYKNKSLENDFIHSSIDSILTKVCSKNGIDRNSIKLHVVEDYEINAFASPGRNLIINSGLIKASDSQEELAGVICHEIAHIELDHVMQSVIKEVGLSILISIATGDKGPETIKQVAMQVSSSSFDRSLEKEADIKAVEYLLNTNINPEPFAEFLYKLSEGNDGFDKYLAWVSTHPDSKDRAQYIIEEINNSELMKEVVLQEVTWSKIKNTLE